MNSEDHIRELEQKIASVCLRCPRAKWYYGWFECRTNRRRCHSSKVRRWLDEIKGLEGKVNES